MSDTSSALPESPESVSSHNALSTGQQTVINKLFRRLIVFLFVLFIFSFLDRYQHRFCRVDDGAGSGVKRHHVWPCHDAVLRHLRHFRHSQQRDVEHRRRPPLDCDHYGAMGHCIYRYDVRGGTEKPVCAANAGGHYRSGLFARNIALFNLLVPGIFSRARANALFMIAMPATTALGSIVSGYILSLDGIFNLHGWQWLFLLEGFPSVFVRHYGLVLPG